jgi:PAS domain S-box-containing protein
MVMDITTRKNAEDARRMNHDLRIESEARYKVLLENIDAPVAIVDEWGKINYINESCARIFGRTRLEMEDRTWYELFPAAVWEERLEVVKRVLTENTP